MKQSWLTGVKEVDEKEEIKSHFAAAYVLRQRLIRMLEKKQESSWSSSVAKDSYESPNWALLQADARGYERALNEVISLLSGQK